MNRNCRLIKTTTAGGLVLATVLLTSAVAAPTEQADADQAKPYPLKKCIVDGKKLSEAPVPYSFNRDGQGVTLCCPKCLPRFDQRSGKYLNKIKRAEKRAAIIAQAASMPERDSSPGGPAWPGWLGPGP